MAALGRCDASQYQIITGNEIAFNLRVKMGIVDTVKELAILAQKVQNIELYQRLISFQSDVFALQEENRDLKDKVRQLSEKLDLQAKVVWEKPFYWLKESETKDGPFCQKCYDSDRKLIRLKDEDNDLWCCLNCKSWFHGPHYMPPRDNLTSYDPDNY